MDKKIVYLSVEGGVVNCEELPEGVQVVVSDYDVEGVDEEELKEDDNGNFYREIIFGE